MSAIGLHISQLNVWTTNYIQTQWGGVCKAQYVHRGGQYVHRGGGVVRGGGVGVVKHSMYRGGGGALTRC